MAISADARDSRPIVMKAGTEAAARINPTGRSQALPCNRACNNAGAASFVAKRGTQDSANTLSCSAYHGTSRNPMAPTASQIRQGGAGAGGGVEHVRAVALPPP